MPRKAEDPSEAPKKAAKKAVKKAAKKAVKKAAKKAAKPTKSARTKVVPAPVPAPEQGPETLPAPEEAIPEIEGPETIEEDAPGDEPEAPKPAPELNETEMAQEIANLVEAEAGDGMSAEPEFDLEPGQPEEAEPAAPRPPAKLERLQKILAQAGIASRRRAEQLITEGRVQVNGQIVSQLGAKADAGRDHIRVDGKLLQGAERLRYFVLNKPRGYVTTVKDPEGRPTVMQFFEKMRERLYPVGRLDYMSEGLLLVTNDGELANRLTKAATGVEKTYLVKVAGNPTEEELDVLRSGVSIPRGAQGTERVRTSPARIRQVRQGDNPWFEVVLIEGRNRELRKMFEEIGHFVEKIRRVGYGPLILDQEPGNLRELDEQELSLLRKAAEGKLRTPKAKEVRRRNFIDSLPPEKPAGTGGRSSSPDRKPPFRPRTADRPAARRTESGPRVPGERPGKSIGAPRAAGGPARGPAGRYPNRYPGRSDYRRPTQDSAAPSSPRPERKPWESRSPARPAPRPGRDFTRKPAAGYSSGPPAPRDEPGTAPGGFREGSRNPESRYPSRPSRPAGPGRGSTPRPAQGQGAQPFPRPERKAWENRNPAPSGDRPARSKPSGPRPPRPFPPRPRDEDFDDEPVRKSGGLHIEPYEEQDRPAPSTSRPFRGKTGPARPAQGQGRPRQGSPGEGRPSSSRPGGARPGQARSGQARSGEARPSGPRPFRGESGLARPFTTSSGKPRPGGARPSSKPSRPSSGPRGEGSRPERGAGSGWKPKPNFSGPAKSSSGPRSKPRPGGFSKPTFSKSKPSGKRPGGPPSGKRRG